MAATFCRRYHSGILALSSLRIGQVWLNCVVDNDDLVQDLLSANSRCDARLCCGYTRLVACRNHYSKEYQAAHISGEPGYT
jgi:hypothetical protein